MGLAVGFVKEASEPCKNASASSVVISRLAKLATEADEGLAVAVLFAVLGFSVAESDVSCIAGVVVSAGPAVDVDFSAEDGQGPGVIRIETKTPKLALKRISASGFVLMNPTSVEVLVGKLSAFIREVAVCESLRPLALSMGLPCRGSMVTFESWLVEHSLADFGLPRLWFALP